LSFDSDIDRSRVIPSNVRNLAEEARPRRAEAALSDDDEKMIVLQSWYQRMSAERIARHHGIPAGQVRRILARRMGGNC
jgi:DNA-directed RNA polymerase specialized sigma24 family protein